MQFTDKLSSQNVSLLCHTSKQNQLSRCCANKAGACQNKQTILLRLGVSVLLQQMYHLLVHSCCNLLIGDGHILCGWGEYTLHQGALPLQIVVYWGGDCKVGKTAEICVCAVQQVVKALASLQ